MSIFLEPDFPTTRGYFSPRELRILALTLGYHSGLFQRAITKGKSSVTEQEIVCWLNHRVLDKDLHALFNNHTYEYNAQVIKATLRHLKYRTLSFSDISSARIAFESETAENSALGLPANKESVLQVLRMIDRVSAPLRVQHVLQGMSRRLQTQGSLKLFEFFDVVATSQPIWSAMKMMEEEEKSKNALLSTTEISADYGMFLETSYQRLLKKLDFEYRKSLIKPRRQHLKEQSCKSHYTHHTSKTTPKYIIKLKASRDRAEQLSIGLMPQIEQSTSLILLSRNGYATLTPKQSLTVLKRAQSRPHTSCPTPIPIASWHVKQY